MLNSTKKRYLFSTLLFLFLCLATVVGFVLIKENQDNRQQASGTAAPDYLLSPSPSGTGTPAPTTAPGSDLNKKGVVSTSYTGNRPNSQSGCGGQGVWMNNFCYMPGDELAGGKVILSSGRYDYPYIEDKKTYESVNFGAETVKKVVGTTESLGSNCGGQGLPINGTCYAYGSTVNGYLVMPPRTDNCNNATGDYCYAFLKKIEVPYVDWQAAVTAYEKDGNLQALEKLYQETYGVSFNPNGLYNAGANNADLLKAQAILSALTSASVLQQQAAAENAELSKKPNLTPDEQAVFDFNNQIINDSGLAGRYQVLDQLNQSTAQQLTISTAVNRMYQDLVTAEGTSGLDALAKEKFIDIFGYDPSEKYGDLNGILGAFGIDQSKLNADRLKYSSAVAAQEQKIDKLNEEYQSYMSSSDANIEDLKKAAIDAGVVTADQLKGLSEAEALAILLTKFSNTSITEARQDATEIVTARQTAIQEQTLVENFMNRGPQDSTMNDLSGLYTLYTGKTVDINVGPDDREALKAFLEAEVAKHSPQVALSLFAQTQDTDYLKNYYANSSAAHTYGTWIPDDPKLLLTSIYGSTVGNELYTDIVLPSRFNQAVDNFTLDGGASLGSVCRELKITDCNINSSNSTQTISLMLDKMYGDDPDVNVPDLAVTYSNQILDRTKDEKQDSFWELFIASVAMSNAGSGNYVYMEDSPQVSYYQQSMDNYSAAVDATKVFNASQTFAYATTNRQELSDYTWGLSYGNALMDDNVFDREFTREELGLTVSQTVNLTFNQLSSQWANVDVAQNIATNYATSKYYDYTGPADTGIANVALLGANNLGVLDYDYQAANGGYYVQKTLDNWGEEIGAFMVNAGSIYAASQMNETAINQSLYFGEDNLTIIDPIEYANEATAEFRAEYSQEEAVKLYQTYLESTKADGATPVSQVTFEEFINDPEIQRSREELNYERLEKVVAPVAAAVVLPAMIVSGAGVPLILGMSSSAFSLYQGAGMKAQALEIQRMDIESRENAIVQSYIENGASEQEITDLRESLDLQVAQLNQQGNLMLANSAVAAITSTGGFLTGLSNSVTAANTANLLSTSGQILTKTGQIGGIALNTYNAYNSGVASYNAFSEGNIGGGVMSGISSLIAASGVAGNAFGLVGPTTYTNKIDYALDRLNIPAGMAVDAQQVSLACFGSSDAFSEKDCTNAWIGLALSAGQNVSQVSSSRRAYIGDVTTAKLTDLQSQLNAVDVEILSLRALGNADPIVARQLELLQAQHANLSTDILALNPNLKITNPGSVENYSATRTEILTDLNARLATARQAGNVELETSLNSQIRLFETSTDQVITLRNQIEDIDRQVQEGGLSLKVEELAELQRQRNDLVANLETSVKDLSVVESLRLQNEAMLQVAKQNEAIDVYREALNKLATVEAYAPKAEDVASYEAEILKTGKVQLETEDSKRLLSIAAMQENASKLAKLEAERQALLNGDPNSDDVKKALVSVEAQIASLRKVTDSATPSMWQRFTDLFARDKANRTAYYKALSLSTEAEALRVKLDALDPASPEAATLRRQVADLDRQILDQKHVLASSLNKPTETQILATAGEQFSNLRDNYNEFLTNQDRLVKLSAELAKLPKDLADADQARTFQRLTAEIDALTKRNTTLEASLLKDVVDSGTKQKLLATPKANLAGELQVARDVELGKIRSDLGLTAKQRRLVTDLIQLRDEVFKAQGEDLTLARSRYNVKLTELNNSILGRNPDLAAYQKLSALQLSLKNITLFDQVRRNPDALTDLLNSKESAINLDDQLLSLKMETMIRETEFRAGVEEGLAFFNSRVNQIDTFLKIISDPRVAVELTTAGGKTFVGALVLKAQVEILDYATGLYIAKPGQEAKITRDLARMYGVSESEVVALDYTRLADKAYVASLLRSRYIVADPANLEFVRNGANNFSDGNFMVANQVYRKLTQNLSIYMDELQINIDPTRQAIVSVGASSEKIPTRYTEVDKFVGDVLAETVLRNGGWGLGDNDFLVLRTSEGAEIAKFSPESQDIIFAALARKMGVADADYKLIKDNAFALDETLTTKGRSDLEQRLKSLGSKLSVDDAEKILDQIDSLNNFAQGLKMKDGTDYKRMIDRVLQANNGLNRQVTVPAAGAVANEGQSYNARLQSVMEYIGAKAHGQTPDFDGLTASPSLAYKSNIADYIGDLQNSSIGAVTGAMADGFGVVETALGLTSYRSTEAVVKILDLENSSTGGRINVDRAYQIDRSDDVSALVALKVNGQLNQSAGLATKGNLKIVLGFDGAKEPLVFAVGMAKSRQFNQVQFAVQNSDGSYSLVKINQGGQVLESRPITTGEIQDMYRGGAENLITIIGRGGATGDSIATNKSVLGVTVTGFDSPEGLVAQAGARIDRTSDVADQFALIVKPGAPRVNTSADLAHSKMTEADFLSFRAKVLEVQIAVEKAKNTQALNQGVTSASTRVLADLIRNSTDPAVQRWASEKLLNFYKESTGRNLSLTGDAAETILARQRQLASEVANWQKLLQDPANAAILRKIKGTDGDFYQRMLVNSGVDPAKLKYASGSRTQITSREAVITARDLGEFISKHSKYVTQDSESRYVADSGRQPKTYQAATTSQRTPVDVAQNQAKTNQAVEALQKLAGSPVEEIGRLFLRGIGASNATRLTHLIERNLPRINAAYGRVVALVDGAKAARSRIANAMADQVDKLLSALDSSNSPIPAEPAQTAAEPEAESQAETQAEPQVETAQPVVEPNNEPAVVQQAPRPVALIPQGGGIAAWFKATNSRIANAMADQIDKWFFAGQPATPTTPTEPAEFVAVEHEEEIEAEIVKLKDKAKAEKLEALQLAQTEVVNLETQQKTLQLQAEGLTEREYGTAVRELAEVIYRLTEAKTKVANLEAEIASIEAQDYRAQAIANLEAANEQGQEQQAEATNTRKGLLSWLPDLSSSSANGRLLSLLTSPEQFLQNKKTPFDVSEELIVLRQTKPNTWQRSMLRKLFRERYAAQLRGIALFRSEVEDLFNADPNASLDQLNKIYDRYQKAYALPDKYKQITKDYFDRYQAHKSKIADLKSRFEGKDAEFVQALMDSIMSKLSDSQAQKVRKILAKNPITSQKISYANDHIVVKLSGEDYFTIFANRGGDALSVHDWSMFADENSFMISAAQGSSGIIFFNNDHQASFNEIIKHERQHVLHWAMFSIGEEGSIQRVRAMAADEILAYFEGGIADQPFEIISKLEADLSGKPKLTYDYFSNEAISDLSLKKTYNKDLELAVNAYQRLKTAGYSHAEIRAIFEGEDMARWPRLANRLSVEHEETKVADLFNTLLANISGKAILHTIGLASNNSLQLLPKFKDVSANHAQLIRTKQGGLSIKDLNSQGGTYIDGSKIDPNKEIALVEGQFIYLGEKTEDNGLIFFVVRRADGRLDVEIAEADLATKPKSQLAVSLTDSRSKASELVKNNWPKMLAFGNDLIKKLFAEPETKSKVGQNTASNRQADEVLEELGENISRVESTQEIEERTRLEDLAKNYSEIDLEVARLTAEISDLRSALEEAERNQERGNVLGEQLFTLREQISSITQSLISINDERQLLLSQREEIAREIDGLDGEEITSFTKEQQAIAAQNARYNLIIKIDVLLDETLQSLIGSNLGTDVGTARSRIVARIKDEISRVDLAGELSNRLSSLPEFASDPEGVSSYSRDIIATLTPDWFISRHLATSRFEVVRQVDPNTERNIVAIGDVHGDWNALVRMLSGQVTAENGDKVNKPLLDRNGNWIGGPTDHLILTGDLFDRAPSGVLSSQTAEKVMKLQQQAGNFPDGTPRVKVLIGNHDVNAIYAYWRMKTSVDKGGIRSKKEAAESASNTGMKPGISPEDLMYLYDHSAIANWVMSLDAMTVRDGVLYMHSDVRGYLDYGLTVNAVNSEIRALMQGKHGMDELRNLMSVLTKRGQLNPENVDELLATYKARKIVHGHSENQNSKDPRVINIDGGLSEHYAKKHGKGQNRGRFFAQKTSGTPKIIVRVSADLPKIELGQIIPKPLSRSLLTQSELARENSSRIEQLSSELQDIDKNLLILADRTSTFELTKQELFNEESKIASLLSKIQGLDVEEMSSTLKELDGQLLEKRGVLEKAGSLLLAQQEVIDFLKSLRERGLRVGLLFVDQEMLKSATVFGNRILSLISEAIRQENFKDSSDIERINLFISNSLPLDALSKRFKNVSSIVKKIRASLKIASDNLALNQQKDALIAEIKSLVEKSEDGSLVISEDLEGMSLEELKSLRASLAENVAELNIGDNLESSDQYPKSLLLPDGQVTFSGITMSVRDVARNAITNYLVAARRYPRHAENIIFLIESMYGRDLPDSYNSLQTLDEKIGFIQQNTRKNSSSDFMQDDFVVNAAYRELNGVENSYALSKMEIAVEEINSFSISENLSKVISSIFEANTGSELHFFEEIMTDGQSIHTVSINGKEYVVRYRESKVGQDDLNKSLQVFTQYIPETKFLLKDGVVIFLVEKLPLDEAIDISTAELQNFANSLFEETGFKADAHDLNIIKIGDKIFYLDQDVFDYIISNVKRDSINANNKGTPILILPNQNSELAVPDLNTTQISSSSLIEKLQNIFRDKAYGDFKALLVDGYGLMTAEELRLRVNNLKIVTPLRLFLDAITVSEQNRQAYYNFYNIKEKNWKTELNLRVVNFLGGMSNSGHHDKLAQTSIISPTNIAYTAISLLGIYTIATFISIGSPIIITAVVAVAFFWLPVSILPRFPQAYYHELVHTVVAQNQNRFIDNTRSLGESWADEILTDYFAQRIYSQSNNWFGRQAQRTFSKDGYTYGEKNAWIKILFDHLNAGETDYFAEKALAESYFAVQGKENSFFDLLSAKLGSDNAREVLAAIQTEGSDANKIEVVSRIINSLKASLQSSSESQPAETSSKSLLTPISLSNEQVANSPEQEIKPLINVRETLRDEDGKLVTRASSSLNNFGRNMTANLYKFGVKSVEDALAFPDQQLARLIGKPVGETTLYRDYLLDPKVSSLINRSLRAKLTYARNQARLNNFMGSAEEFMGAGSSKPLAKTFSTLYWYKYGQNANLFNVYGLRQSFLPFVNWYLSLPENQRPSIALVEKLFIHGIVDSRLTSSLDGQNLNILQGFATKLRAHAPYTILNNVVSLQSELNDEQLEKVLVQIGALFPNGFKLDALSSNRYQDKIVASKKYSLHADGFYRKFNLATPVNLPKEKVKTTTLNLTDRLLGLIGRPIEYLWVRSGGRSVAGAIEERILGYRTGAITPERAKQAVRQGLITGLSWSVPTYFGEFGRAAYGVYRFATNFYKNGSNIIAQISSSLREAKTVQEKAGLLFLGVGSGVGTYYVQSFSPLAYQMVMVIDTFNTNFINAAKSYQIANRIASSGAFRVLEMIKNANSFAYLVNGVNNFLGNAAVVVNKVEQINGEGDEGFVYNDGDYPSLENQAEPTEQVQSIEEVQPTQETQSAEEATEELAPLPDSQSLTVNDSDLNPSIVTIPGEEIEFGTYKPLPLDNKLNAVVVPKEIILHWDGQSGYRNGWTTQGTFNGLNGPVTSAYTGLEQTLDSHFGVGINGVDQFLPMYENGVQYSYAASGYPDTINIEIAGSKFIDGGELNMNPDQFDHTVDLVSDLLITYDLPVSAIVGHHQRDLIQEMYYVNADGERINQYYFGETEALGRSLDAAVVADYLGEDGKWHSILVGPNPDVADRQPVDYEVVGELLNPATDQPFDKGKPDVGDEFLQIVQDEVALQLAQEGYVYENGEWVANIVQDDNQVLPPLAESGTLVYQSQTDEDWADILLPESSSNDIAKAGCGPTTVSMLLATFVDPTYTPDRVIEEFFPNISSGSDYSLVRSTLEENGFQVLKGPGSSWSMHDYFEENEDGIIYVGLKFYVNGQWTTHHTLATGTNADGEIIMHDPFFGQGAIISSDGTTITATDGTVLKVEIIGSAEIIPPSLSYASENNSTNENVVVETDFAEFVNQEIAESNVLGTLLLDENYEPEQLDNLRDYGITTIANNNIYLHEDAVPPLLEFIKEVKETYGYDIGVAYGYRSYQQQDAIYQENPSGAAEAGRSQHQTGFAVDLLIFENGEKKQDLPKELYPIAAKYGIYHPLAWDSPHFVVVSGIDPTLDELVSSGEMPLNNLNSFLNDVFQRHQQDKLDLALTDEDQDVKVNYSESPQTNEFDYLISDNAQETMDNIAEYIGLKQQDGSIICGPLSAYLMQENGFLSEDLPAIKWLQMNDYSKEWGVSTLWMLEKYLPVEKYEWFETTESVSDFDFSNQPLEVGDLLYLKGYSVAHWVTVTRVDDQGRVFAITNVQAGYLDESNKTDQTWLIQEVMLYDPQNPDAGQFDKWTDKYDYDGLHHIGEGGFRLWRLRDGGQEIGQVEFSSNN